MTKLFRPAWLVILIVTFFLGCGGQANREAAQQPATQFAVDSPATFSGVLPCADCAGIRYTLNLEPANAFYWRQTYLGKGEGEGESFYDIGSWSLSEDGKTLTLQGSGEAPLTFAVKSAEMLSKLDLEGKEIQSQLNYNLTRAGQFEWFAVPFRR